MHSSSPRPYVRLVHCIVLAASVSLFGLPCLLQAQPAPEPDPPEFFLDLPQEVSVSPGRLQDTETVEWLFHKTPEGDHPDGNEQQMLWLMNRARTNPPAEGVWLATMDDPDVVQDRTSAGVNLQVLMDEFAVIPAKFPAAFDVRLYHAAKEHSDWMISVNAQSHTGQLERVQNSGFEANYWRGSIFAWAKTALHGHAALNIDWGTSTNSDQYGMQPGRGHRVSIMSIDGDLPRNLTNVGISVVQTSGSYPATVGPLVTTANYCTANTFGYFPPENHYNRFLVGTVWKDLNGNSLYDPGEGMADVAVMPDHGMFHAVTANSGGYAIPILSEGAYQVTFSGPSLPAVMKTANVGSVSVLLDLQLLEKGDINGDGSIDLTDAVLALQVISGLNPEGVNLENYASSGADVNGDRKIGWEEVVYIVQKVKGSRP